MSSDPTDTMLQYSGDVYDNLLKDAEKDIRVGDHDAICVKRALGTWPDGEPRYKFDFNLLTAGNAKADLTWSVPPSAEVIQAEKEEWGKSKEGQRKMRGIAHNVAIAREVIKHYNKLPLDIQEGEKFRVKTTKTRRDDEGKGGFIRVIAFLAPAGAAAAPGSEPKF